MAAQPHTSGQPTRYIPLGPHLDGDQCLFHIYAPHAEKVSLLGDFSHWYPIPMKRGRSGIWRVTLDHIQPGQAYQFNITTAGGTVLRKSDPCGPGFQQPPLRASVIHDLHYDWQDAPWLRVRRSAGTGSAPMNLYQVDLLSWRRNGDGSMMPASKLAPWLVPHAKRLGATHIELLPVMDFDPQDGTGSFFGLNPALGTPRELMRLIDLLHQAGLGVILDWEMSRFSKDLFGLDQFDGESTFEGSSPQHFDFSRPAVRNFLMESARFWVEVYHADGLKLSHLDDLLWVDGKENPDAISFLRDWNGTLHREYPTLTTIAQGGTDWPHVTGPLSDSRALGFDLCWNLRWQETALHYQQMDPIYRRSCHEELTGTLRYAFDERYILPFSLDLAEQQSLVERMPGNDNAHKQAGVRTFYLYLLTQPGKKLLAMGSEFSQFSPWNRSQSLDWHLLQYPQCQRQLAFFQAAGDLYLSSPALWDGEGTHQCYRWLEGGDSAGNTLLYLRLATGGETVLVALNFSGLDRRSVCVGVPRSGSWEVLLSTDDRRWGGRGKSSAGTLRANPIPRHGQEQSLFLDLPPLSGVVLRPAP